MKTAFAIVLPAAVMAVSAPAVAQQSDAGWYIGGSYGMSTFDLDTTGITNPSVEDGDSGFKIFGGFQFTKHWGAEVGYVDFGKAGIRGSVIGIPFTGDLGITAFTLAGTGTLPLGTNFALLGKVGLAQWEADASVSGAGSASDSGSDMFYGIGARYSFNKNLSVQAEYEVLDMDVDSVTMMSIGLRYKF
jgi:OOP family OmpA-OmpF porin